MAITSVRGEQLRDGDVEAVDLATNSVTTTKIADANVTIAKINFDHGDLGGAADDDHTQYILANGTRSFSQYVLIDEGGSTATPATSKIKIYAKVDGKVYSKDSAGTEYDLTAGGVTDADTLDSLDSTAFFILNGQSGGQTAYGGSAAANDLVLLSTSNASKGNVIIATNAAENVGVGTASPSQKLHVSGAMRLTAHFYDTDNGAGTNGQVLSSTGSATRWKNFDHGDLSGLTDDDHTQYALLAGRSGGQTLIGGTASGNNLTLTSTSHATKGLIVCNQSLFVNDTANANMTTGVTLNQSGADDEIIALKSSDVSHGVTGVTEDDTYATLKKQSATGGGLELAGFHEGGGGVNVRGIGVTDDPNKSTSAAAYAMIGASKKSGTSAGAAGADANILAVRNHTTTRWIVDAEGDTHRDGTDNTYDAWEDAELARAFDLVMSPASTIDSEFDKFVRYKRHDLIEAGLLSEGGFYNESRLLRLHNGAIWQIHCRIAELEKKLLEVDDRPK